MQTKLLTITPEWAKKVLDDLQKDQEAKTFAQRNPNKRAIDRYASDMRAGKWLVTHQGIAFDDKQHLLDGQNRLWAVVKSGATVQMLVTTGIPGNGKLTAMDTIDAGVNRGLAAQLQISHGFGSEAAEASVMVRNVTAIALLAFGMDGRPIISTRHALFILKDMGFEGAHERARILLPEKKLRHRAMLSSWCWLWMADKECAERFAVDYANLTDLKAGSPVLALTKMFAGILAYQKRPKEYRLIESSCNALKAYAESQTVAHLKPSREALKWLVMRSEKKASKIIESIKS